MKMIKLLLQKAQDKITAVELFIVAMFFSLQAKANFDMTGTVGSGDSFNDVATNITGISETAFTLIKIIAGLAGLGIVFMGVMHIKKSQDPNSGVTAGRGVVYLIVGGLLGALPWLYQMSTTTVSG